MNQDDVGNVFLVVMLSGMLSAIPAFVVILLLDVPSGWPSVAVWAGFGYLAWLALKRWSS